MDSTAGPTSIPPAVALELRLRHYTDKVYAHRPHESLGGDTPWQRFHQDPKPLRFPDDEHSLRNKFEVSVERRVTSDHVVSLDSVSYEMPRGYAGRKVTLRRRLLDGSIGFLHDGKLIDLHTVDLVGNARAQRAKDRQSHEREHDSPPPITAAELAFQREFGPVVDADGGFHASRDVGDRADTDDPQDYFDTQETS